MTVWQARAAIGVYELPASPSCVLWAAPLASVFMMSSFDEKKPFAASNWGKSVLYMSTEMMSEEKRTEVPVMKLLVARDALLDVCKSKLTQ